MSRDNITLPREVVKESLKVMDLICADLVCGIAHHGKKDRHGISDPCPICDRWQKAFDTLRTALAAPKQEPVAKVELKTTGGNVGLATRIVEIDDPLRDRLRPGQLLYVAPSDDIEALRRDAERYEWLLDWLHRHGLLSLEITRIDTPESHGYWFVLRKPHSIDGSSLLGYGKTADAAIDKAMNEAALRREEDKI